MSARKQSTEKNEAVQQAKAVLQAAMILAEPEQETPPELVHALLTVAHNLLGEAA